MKEKPGLHHLSLLYIITKFALIISLPSWFYMDFVSILQTHALNANIVACLILDGFLTFLQNVVAFTVLSLVSPLTYSVCNSSKRIFVIIISLVTMKNPITLTNSFGMSIAVFGVLLYNRAKHEQNKAKELPVYINHKVTNPLSPVTNGYVNGYKPQATNGYQSYSYSYSTMIKDY